MNALKYVGLLSIALLCACASKTQNLDDNFLANQNSPNTISKGNNENITEPMNETSTETGDKKASDLKQEKSDKKGSQAAAASVAKTAASSISSWELSGAMAAKSKSKAWSASINWVQRGAGSYQIRLFGPIGSGTVMIQKQGGTVSFRDGSKTATSGNAEQLLVQQTGIRLPVSSLYYWVRGLPAPGGVQSVTKDASGHLTMLRQGGYTIQYLSYTKARNAYLPSQIRLQGNGIFIKLVIRRWNV